MDKKRRIWIVAGIVLAAVLAVVVGMQMLFNADTYRGRIEAALSSSLGRSVQLGHLEASVLSGSLVASAPSIADDPAFGSQPFMTAKTIRIGVEMGPLLLHHELHITGITIQQPQIRLVRAANGTWNFSSIGGKRKSADPPATDDVLPNLTVGKMAIRKAMLTIERLPSTGQARTYSDVDVTAQEFSLAKAFPFSVSGKLPGDGSVEVRGTAGPINQQDASLTPLTAQVLMEHADLVQAGFVEPQQGIAGVADLDAKVVSNGTAAQVSGKLHLAELKLASRGAPSSEPVDCRFEINQDLRSLSGRLSNGMLQIGQAALSISGTYETQGNATKVAMKANGQNMPIDPLVAFLPSLGLQLPPGAHLQGGTLTLALDVSGPTTATVISGPVRIANTQLAGFDLGQKLASIQALTGSKTGSTTTIQSLSTNLRYGPDGVRTDNLAAVVVGIGSASGSGSISPAGALDYHLLVKPSSTGAGAVAGQAISLLSGALGSAVTQNTKNGIPLVIGGTTSSPTFTPDMSKMVGGMLQQKKTQQANPLSKTLGGLLGR